MELSEIQEMAGRIRDHIGEVIVGKEKVIEQLLIALIASGHVLLEDVPGTGKTLLAKALARSIRCDCKRVQFTPDLMPSDVSGVHFFNQKQAEFEFRPGPVFTNILLADEINRATPRTQSSLLECMEERQVSVDGETMPLDRPFLVIATQNPIENQGTFPLPEAQLDRFLLKVRMGYPSSEEGAEILKRFKASDPLAALEPVSSAEHIVEMQNAYSKVHVSDLIIDYIVKLAEASREHPEVATGISPRGTQALLRAVQAHALLRGRDFVSPDDVKEMALPVLAHRMVLQYGSRRKAQQAEDVVGQLLRQVVVPAEEQLNKGR